jgi:hypothetical protein
MSHDIEFHFYLDAWLWCRQNDFDFKPEYMVKKDFRTWTLSIPEDV